MKTGNKAKNQSIQGRGVQASPVGWRWRNIEAMHGGLVGGSSGLRLLAAASTKLLRKDLENLTTSSRSRTYKMDLQEKLGLFPSWVVQNEESEKLQALKKRLARLAGLEANLQACLHNMAKFIACMSRNPSPP